MKQKKERNFTRKIWKNQEEKEKYLLTYFYHPIKTQNIEKRIIRIRVIFLCLKH
jgi:hypothetical protein